MRGFKPVLFKGQLYFQQMLLGQLDIHKQKNEIGPLHTIRQD